MLAYHVRGFTFPIQEMRPKMRRGMMRRLVDQKNRESKEAEAAVSQIKSSK